MGQKMETTRKFQEPVDSKGNWDTVKGAPENETGINKEETTIATGYEDLNCESGGGTIMSCPILYRTELFLGETANHKGLGSKE